MCQGENSTDSLHVCGRIETHATIRAASPVPTERTAADRVTGADRHCDIATGNLDADAAARNRIAANSAYRP
jgi:hypothetical protein